MPGPAQLHDRGPATDAWIEDGMILGRSFAGEHLRHSAGQALPDAGSAAEVAPGLWFSAYGEPAGVVGIIVPWNSPVALLIRSLGPALAAGNTVAVKMPAQTALVANLALQILAEVTSLRRGVVSIFTESGNTGAPYLSSPDVQVISHSGTSVGRLVAAAGASTLKRMNLELGGKTPMIAVPPFPADCPRVRGTDADLHYAVLDHPVELAVGGPPEEPWSTSGTRPSAELADGASDGAA